MEKAYDVKVLIGKLKARGLDVAEEAGKILVEETFAWLGESADVSENPYDNMAKVIYPKAKEFALAQIDKLDGVQG